MPHGGQASARKHADRFRARLREREDILHCMLPDKTGAGRLVSHGAGPAPICEWAAHQADTPLWLLAATGELRCAICDEPLSLADYDASGTNRHPECLPPASTVHRPRLYPVEVQQDSPVLPQVDWEVEPGTWRVVARIGNRKVPLRAGDGSPMRADLYPSTIALEVSASAAADRLRDREALRLVTQWLHQPADLVTVAFAELAVTAARRPGGKAASVLEYWSSSLTATSLNTLQALIPHAGERQWTELIELAAAAARDGGLNRM